MKKKLLAVNLVIALIAIAVVGGTLAWFKDTEEVSNVFTVGSIKIRQNEEFVQNSTLIPIIPNGTQTPTDDENFVSKIVTVTNTGKNSAYIQTFVAIPAALDGEGKLDEGLLRVYYTNAAEGNGWKAIDGNITAGGIQPVAYDVVIENKPYNVYKFRNSQMITGGQTTAAVIEGVYIDAAADLNIYKDDSNNITAAYFVWNGAEITGFNVADMQLDVYVVSQAVQSQEFSDAETALSSGFGDTIPPFVTN